MLTRSFLPNDVGAHRAAARKMWQTIIRPRSQATARGPCTEGMGACSAKVKDPHGKCAPEDMGTKHQPAARSLQGSASSRLSERDTGPLSDRSRLREKVRAGVARVKHGSKGT